MNNSKDLGEKSSATSTGSSEFVQRRNKALLAELSPHQQATVLQVMKNHPEIPLAETIAMLKAFGL